MKDEIVTKIAIADTPVTPLDEALATMPAEYRDQAARALESLAKSPLAQIVPGSVLLTAAGERLLTFPAHFAEAMANGTKEPKELDAQLAAIPDAEWKTLSDAILSMAEDEMLRHAGSGACGLLSAAATLRDFDQVLAGVKAKRQANQPANPA